MRTAKLNVPKDFKIQSVDLKIRKYNCRPVGVP